MRLGEIRKTSAEQEYIVGSHSNTKVTKPYRQAKHVHTTQRDIMKREREREREKEEVRKGGGRERKKEGSKEGRKRGGGRERRE